MSSSSFALFIYVLSILSYFSIILWLSFLATSSFTIILSSKSKVYLNFPHSHIIYLPFFLFIFYTIPLPFFLHIICHFLKTIKQLQSCTTLGCGSDSQLRILLQLLQIAIENPFLQDQCIVLIARVRKARILLAFLLCDRVIAL